jgi:hypothetical protein
MSRKHGGEGYSGKAFSASFDQTAFSEVRLAACVATRLAIESSKDYTFLDESPRAQKEVGVRD